MKLCCSYIKDAINYAFSDCSAFWCPFLISIFILIGGLLNRYLNHGSLKKAFDLVEIVYWINKKEKKSFWKKSSSF